MATIKCKAIQANAGGGAIDTLHEVDVEVAAPVGRQLRVRVHAVGMNPVDCKCRAVGGLAGPVVQFGYDASGVVEAVGADAKFFRVGDAVYYSGEINKAGTNAEYHLVDERIVGRKPAALSHADAAAVPLVAITAWEGLFESMRLDASGAGRDADLVVLVVNGAGGVGSIAIQLAKTFMRARTVVATASRDATVAWCKKMGADHVINHREPLKPQLDALGVARGADVVLDLVDVDSNFDAVVDATAPGGAIYAITHGGGALDATKLFIPRRASLHWGFMFARPMLDWDAHKQHALLNRVAQAYDDGELAPIAAVTKAYSVDELRAAHTLQESGKSMGKIVLVVVPDGDAAAGGAAAAAASK